MAGKLTVHCAVSPGLTLRLHKMVKDEAGVVRAVRHGGALTLTKGINENVDADFMSEWLDQNAKSSLVTNGAFHIEGSN